MTGRREGMTAKGCEEEILTYGSLSGEELKVKIEALRTPLSKAFSDREDNLELVRNPQVWVDYIQDAIERTRALLAIRTAHPKLEEDFARLETSYQRAKTQLPGYAGRKKVAFSEHALL